MGEGVSHLRYFCNLEVCLTKPMQSLGRTVIFPNKARSSIDCELLYQCVSTIKEILFSMLVKSKKWKISKRYSESVDRSTDNMVAKRKTINNDKHNITQKTNNRATRTQLKPECFVTSVYPLGIFYFYFPQKSFTFSSTQKTVLR